MAAGFLLDTVVLSATGPDRGLAGDPAKQAARAWIAAEADRIFLPSIALAEIAAGIGTHEGAGAARRAEELAVWLRMVVAHYPERLLTFDLAAALHARPLARAAREAGQRPGFADLAVACIASANGLAVATRNLRHFMAFGIETVDPFS